ncbi:universal stress protein [Halobaculum sp. CBA1158]|uniref:universal stress protein n=1 Tax=Halobaculum sp. CBA1158 TaxID=2904243 RepID=UPI001F29EAB7|nr:universal stress protein [Halobaculum sp. CBA1158]UIO99291.1 universal stress protein [Halobaculum sp. CBA1158]
MDGYELSEIVVATDGSDPAEAAVGEAIALAAAVGARVHPCAVVDPYLTGQRVTDVAKLRSDASERVEAAAERAREAGVDADPVVREGTPHEEIGAHVESVGADLLVVGTHGRRGARRVLLGSVAEKVIRTATVPVLAVHGGDERPTWGDGSRLLVATDGSTAAVPAERVGVGLAAALNADITAVSALDEAEALAGACGGALSTEVVESVRSALAERAERAVDRVRDRAEAAGVDAEGEVIGGEPIGAIRDHAADVDADLVVVGTHGRTGVRRVLLGSVAEGIVRSADRPVLVVPSAMDEDADENVDGN